MPYEIKKSGKGYYVVNIETNKKFSNKPIPRANAEKQMKLLQYLDSKPLKKKK